VTCDKCGAELPKGWSNPAWAECAICVPPKIAVNVGPQPHLMSKGEVAMHMRNKHDIERRVRAGEPIEFKEKGPMEFRPKP
jgi:hypothetical protein